MNLHFLKVPLKNMIMNGYYYGIYSQIFLFSRFRPKCHRKRTSLLPKCRRKSGEKAEDGTSEMPRQELGRRQCGGVSAHLSSESYGDFFSYNFSDVILVIFVMFFFVSNFCDFFFNSFIDFFFSR